MEGGLGLLQSFLDPVSCLQQKTLSHTMYPMPRTDGLNDVRLLVDATNRREISGLIQEVATPYGPIKGSKSVRSASS